MHIQDTEYIYLKYELVLTLTLLHMTNAVLLLQTPIDLMAI